MLLQGPEPQPQHKSKQRADAQKQFRGHREGPRKKAREGREGSFLAGGGHELGGGAGRGSHGAGLGKGWDLLGTQTASSRE